MINPMVVPILSNEINTRNDLIALAQTQAKDLKIEASIDPVYFLLALFTMESAMGRFNVPRFELSYSRSSLAYKRSKLLQEGYELWGDQCAMSYGPAQILWIVAKELGFPGHPLELWHGAVSVPYVVRLLNKLHVGGANTKEKLAAAYNAGLGALKNTDRWPKNYVNNFLIAYEECQNKYR